MIRVEPSGRAPVTGIMNLRLRGESLWSILRERAGHMARSPAAIAGEAAALTRTKLGLAFAAAAMTLVIASCSGADKSEPEAAIPDAVTSGGSLEPLPGASASAPEVSAPSESSNSHANTQVMALLNELLSTRRFHDTIQRQIVDCMAASGFEYAPERYYQETTIIGQKYGITDIVQASTTGYGPSGSLGNPQPNAGLEGLSESERSAWAIAFFGTGKESIELDSGDVLGIRIGGCLDEAESAVYGSRVTRRATISRLQDILLRSWHESSVDARVQAAFAEWRACMADRGLPSNDFDGPRELAARNPDREIEIATVDAQCNAEANLGEIWFEVDAASQKRLLTEDEALVLAAADLLDQLAGG